MAVSLCVARSRVRVLSSLADRALRQRLNWAAGQGGRAISLAHQGKGEIKYYSMYSMQRLGPGQDSQMAFASQQRGCLPSLSCVFLGFTVQGPISPTAASCRCCTCSVTLHRGASLSCLIHCTLSSSIAYRVCPCTSAEAHPPCVSLRSPPCAGISVIRSNVRQELNALSTKVVRAHLGCRGTHTHTHTFT